MTAIWKVWPIDNPDQIDESEPIENFEIEGPEAAVEIACDGDLDFCDGLWLASGDVVTLVVEAPSGEQWTCAAWLTPGEARRFGLSPMVPRERA